MIGDCQHLFSLNDYAALLEWSLITPNDHNLLQDLLGPESAGSTLTIALGVDGAREIMERDGIKA